MMTMMIMMMTSVDVVCAEAWGMHVHDDIVAVAASTGDMLIV